MVNSFNLSKPSKLQKQRKATTPIVLLGDMVFELVDAPRRFQFTEKSTYSEISKIEAKPGLQWTGEALHTLTLDFRLNPAWCNPEEQLQELQKAREEHTTLPLTIGTGVFTGDYVIEEISSHLNRTDLQGNIVECAVSVKLKETVRTKAPKTITKSPFLKRFSL